MAKQVQQPVDPENNGCGPAILLLGGIVLILYVISVLLSI